MDGVIDYWHFGETTENSGWDFYCKINKPKFNYIFETPTTALQKEKLFKNMITLKRYIS